MQHRVETFYEYWDPPFSGSIAPSVDENKLTVYFTNFGKVESCKVVRDRATNISKGFGFVTFLSAQVSDAGFVMFERN